MNPSRSMTILVALLTLASAAVWVAAPVADAQAVNVTVDASATYDAGAYGDLNPSSMPLVYNATYTLKIARVDNSASASPLSDTFRLCQTTAANTTECAPVGNSARGVSIVGSPGHINLTFTNRKVDATGVWYLLNATDAAPNSIVDTSTVPVYAKFLVTAAANLHVTLSRSTFPVSRDEFDVATFTLTVTNAANEAVAATLQDDCDACIVPSETVTDANGQFVYSGPLLTEGTFTLIASATVLGPDDLRPATSVGSATLSVVAPHALVSTDGGDLAWLQAGMFALRMGDAPVAMGHVRVSVEYDAQALLLTQSAVGAGQGTASASNGLVTFDLDLQGASGDATLGTMTFRLLNPFAGDLPLHVSVERWDDVQGPARGADMQDGIVHTSLL